MKIVISITVLLSSLISAGAYANMGFLPDDVAKLNKTKVCVACDLTGKSFYDDYNNVDLHDSMLNRASFNAINNANLSHCNMIKIKIESATGSNFTGSDLRRANLIYGNLSSANFTNANLEGTDLRNANLSGANFDNALLSGADLSYTDLMTTNITDAQLKVVKSLCHAILPDGSEGRCN